MGEGLPTVISEFSIEFLARGAVALAIAQRDPNIEEDEEHEADSRGNGELKAEFALVVALFNEQPLAPAKRHAREHPLSR